GGSRVRLDGVHRTATRRVVYGCPYAGERPRHHGYHVWQDLSRHDSGASCGSEPPAEFRPARRDEAAHGPGYRQRDPQTVHRLAPLCGLSPECKEHNQAHVTLRDRPSVLDETRAYQRSELGECRELQFSLGCLWSARTRVVL